MIFNFFNQMPSKLNFFSDMTIVSVSNLVLVILSGYISYKTYCYTKTKDKIADKNYNTESQIQIKKFWFNSFFLNTFVEAINNFELSSKNMDYKRDFVENRQVIRKYSRKVFDSFDYLVFDLEFRRDLEKKYLELEDLLLNAFFDATNEDDIHLIFQKYKKELLTTIYNYINTTFVNLH